MDLSWNITFVHCVNKRFRVISRTETYSKITGEIPQKFIDALRKDLEVL